MSKRSIVICLSLIVTWLAFLSYPEELRLSPTPDPKSKDNVYIPVNLEDTFVELDKMLPQNVRNEMKRGTKDDMVKFHFGLGLWIRNNWKLWGNSRSAQYFEKIGIHHPDDMSSLILEGYWCYLNTQPFHLEQRVIYFQTYWKANEDPKNKQCPQDGSIFEITSWLYDKSTEGMPRVIHVGRCKKNNHLWVYEHDRGWYKPADEQLKRINSK